MSLTKPTNNLMSNVMVNSRQPEPAVGMGATQCLYTDRHAGTITAIKKNKVGKVTAFTFQQDTATRTDKNGMSDTQHYVYTPNVDGITRDVTLRKNGRWVDRGTDLNGCPSYVIGERDEFHDYSF
jgi:hypothetical protein